MTQDEKNGRIAEVTLKAVDQIGEAAAKEIDQAAANILQDAEELAAQLTELAGNLRKQTIAAAGMVGEFVQKSARTTEIIRQLEEKLHDNLRNMGHGSEPQDSRRDSTGTAEVPGQEIRSTLGT